MSAEIIAVTGGSAGLAATYAAVRALADAYDDAGDRLRRWSVLGAQVGADPDLAESALLSPLSFAEAEAAVLAATTGPDGVLVESLGWEADAIAVRAVVAALEAADDLVQAAIDQIDHAVGRAVGFTLGATAPVLVPALIATVPHVPHRYWRDLEDWVVEHPDVVQHTANGGGGLLEGLWDGLTPLSPGGPLGLPLSVPGPEAGAGLLSLAYLPGGRPEVHPLHQVRVPGSDTQPEDLESLLTHLQDVAALSPDPDSALNGTIEIQTFGAGTDGVRHIVYLPGTDDIATLPWDADDDVRDTGTDLLCHSGEYDGYQQGIVEAMAQAGIGPHDPVLLVGHSLGGMEAATILSHGSGFDVTNVVTAGAPTAQLDGFPAGSHVISLEQHGDVVPLVDGSANADTTEQVTVGFDDHATGVLDAHGYQHYIAGAAAADASTHPSVQEQLASLHAHGFLAPQGGPGAPASAQVFQIVRQP